MSAPISNIDSEICKNIPISHYPVQTLGRTILHTYQHIRIQAYHIPLNISAFPGDSLSRFLRQCMDLRSVSVSETSLVPSSCLRSSSAFSSLVRYRRLVPDRPAGSYGWPVCVEEGGGLRSDRVVSHGGGVRRGRCQTGGLSGGGGARVREYRHKSDAV